MMSMGQPRGPPGQPQPQFYSVGPSHPQMQGPGQGFGGPGGAGGRPAEGWQGGAMGRKPEQHDYYLGSPGLGQSSAMAGPHGPQGPPGSLGYGQAMPLSPQGGPAQPGGFNPLQRGMRPGVGGPGIPGQPDYLARPAGFGYQQPGQPAGQPGPGGFGDLRESGAGRGAPGPKAGQPYQNGFGYSGPLPGGVHPGSVQFKPTGPQPPQYYEQPQDPNYALGDPRDPLANFRPDPLASYRPNAGRVDLEHESRGKVGYSPKPRREDLPDPARRQPPHAGENLIQSQYTFNANPSSKKAPPKPILKRTGESRFGPKPKSATFNQDVLVHEVESWKIYNVDMAKEAKKNFRRENQSECRLL